MTVDEVAKYLGVHSRTVYRLIKANKLKATKVGGWRIYVEDVKDLRPGMILEGVVTNVAAFGAFVDIGVHQDGLVHVSALANTFVKDPHAVVKAGQVVKVKVLEVDLPRQRIALTMRMGDEPKKSDPGSQRVRGRAARDFILDFTGRRLVNMVASSSAD